MALNYRRDVDGLRAVAVLSVVLYHLGLPFPFNGFVGVDIFFVISGFLITGLLYKDISAGRFSLITFYVRRIKRILPALFVMVLVVTLIGAALMLPSDLKDLGKAGFSAVASVSNVYFWYSEDTSYFARSSELVPLLHTWSLGVEEQFYFIWPLLMFGVISLFGFRGIVVFSVLVVLVSTIYSEHLLTTDPSFSFYMLPSRAGELLTGSIAFFAATRERPSHWPSWQLDVVAAAGVALILYSLFAESVAAPFPGYNAVYSCAGTALIIFSGSFHTGFVSKTLGVRPMVAVGLVSYSLYLWHWPVLSIARYLYTSLTPVTMLVCILMFSCLTLLSYFFIELPFRRRAITPARAFGGYVLIPASLLVPLTLSLYFTNGLKSHITSDPQYVSAMAEREQFSKAAYEYDYVCQTDEHGPSTFAGNTCVVGATGGDPNILLWGDSQAAQFVGFLAVMGEHRGYSIRNLQVGNCPPVFDSELAYLGQKQKRDVCTDFRDQVRTEISNYEYVVLGGIWRDYMPHPEFQSDLRATVDEILAMGKKVVLLGQIPSFPYYHRDCKLRNSRFLKIDCEQHADRKVLLEEKANALLTEIAEISDDVRYFQIGDFVCDPVCSPYRNGRHIYYDKTHVSIFGSRWLGEEYLDRVPQLFGAVDGSETGRLRESSLPQP